VRPASAYDPLRTFLGPIQKRPFKLLKAPWVLAMNPVEVAERGGGCGSARYLGQLRDTKAVQRGHHGITWAP
jgi:hypothetical protein